MPDVTTDIPGGKATWFTRSSMPPRRERMMQTEILPLRHLMESVKNPEYPITSEEATKLLSVNELAVAVYLKSWTLTDGVGNALPVPSTPDEVLDIEDPQLYQALISQAADFLGNSADTGFSIDSVEDEDSPTVALDA
jgi:hypothetical protein